MEPSQVAPVCSIQQVGKQRNGSPRFWCSTHQSSATGRYGTKLDVCESAYRFIEHTDVFELVSSDYPGGVGLWGAVPPVYDTTNFESEAGIHVHARMEIDGEKIIDRTFSAVSVHYQPNLFIRNRAIISRETAVNYYISRYLNRDIRHLFCIHCGEVHLDAGFYAVKPHHKHLCHACGKIFNDTSRSVSNPIALLQAAQGSGYREHVMTRAAKTLEIDQSAFRGGIQIWASNPAFIWTRPRDEEIGLHVHTFDERGKYILDDTYGAVTVDGEVLNESHVRHYMAQRTLQYLQNKLESLRCPSCDHPHFDEGELGFFPHIDHTCEHCRTSFVAPGRRRMCVSNPFVATRSKLASRGGTDAKPRGEKS